MKPLLSGSLSAALTRVCNRPVGRSLNLLITLVQHMMDLRLLNDQAADLGASGGAES